MAETNAVEVQSPSMNSAVLGMQNALRQNNDIRSGREAILTNKSYYITQLEEQSPAQYNAMAEMAPYYILYPKVVDGFTGTIFSKSPNLKGVDRSDKQKEQDKNVDMLGNSIDQFSEKVVQQVLENGFCASYNDYSEKEKRAFLRLVKPEQFVSFRTSTINGYPKISQFIYQEEIEVDDPDNEFDYNIHTQYTVLDLTQNPQNKNELNFRVRIYQAVNPKDTRTAETGEKMVLKSESFPIKDGKHFEEIPIVIHGVESNNFTVDRSLLQDISDMNISVFQRTVDQVYMLHWTALPTPYVTGADDKDSPNTIGPSKMWHITDPDAKVGMLEFTGQSATAHQNFIDNLLHIMSVMGAQILKKEGVSRETATSVLVRTSQQTSLVATMVNNVSGQLQTTLQVYYEWSGISVGNDFEYVLNDDFIKVDMEPNAQIALVKSWLDGAISFESMFNKMKEGEIIDPNKTMEDELEDIQENPPPFFLETMEAENAAKLDKENKKDEMKGSNLETDEFGNPLATEQV